MCLLDHENKANILKTKNYNHVNHSTDMSITLMYILLIKDMNVDGAFIDSGRKHIKTPKPIILKKSMCFYVQVVCIV